MLHNYNYPTKMENLLKEFTEHAGAAWRAAHKLNQAGDRRFANVCRTFISQLEGIHPHGSNLAHQLRQEMLGVKALPGEEEVAPRKERFSTQAPPPYNATIGGESVVIQEENLEQVGEGISKTPPKYENGSGLEESHPAAQESSTKEEGEPEEVAGKLFLGKYSIETLAEAKPESLANAHKLDELKSLAQELGLDTFNMRKKIGVARAIIEEAYRVS